MSLKKAEGAAASDPQEPSVPGDILPFAPLAVAYFNPNELSIPKLSLMPLCSRLPLFQSPGSIATGTEPASSATFNFAPFLGPSLKTAEAPVPVPAYVCTSEYLSPEESSLVSEG
jgi:hypothetical protein